MSLAAASSSKRSVPTQLLKAAGAQCRCCLVDKLGITRKFGVVDKPWGLNPRTAPDSAVTVPVVYYCLLVLCCRTGVRVRGGCSCAAKCVSGYRLAWLMAKCCGSRVRGTAGSTVALLVTCW